MIGRGCGAGLAPGRADGNPSRSGLTGGAAANGGAVAMTMVAPCWVTAAGCWDSPTGFTPFS